MQWNLSTEDTFGTSHNVSIIIIEISTVMGLEKCPYHRSVFISEYRLFTRFPHDLWVGAQGKCLPHPTTCKLLSLHVWPVANHFITTACMNGLMRLMHLGSLEIF